MGINYYLQREKCPTCGHEPTQIHLGKSSAGWQFSFQYNGGKFYKNVEEMKEWLKGKQIVGEYDAPVSYEDFWQMVEEKQKPEFKNHAIEMIKSEQSSYYDNVIGGYSFTDREFS